MEKEKGLVVHISLSEEGKKEAQRVAKEIMDRWDVIKHDFLKMGGHNITPHTDRAPSGCEVWETRPLVQMTRSHMKVNPVIVPTKDKILNDLKGISPKVTIFDEVTEWLNEQRKRDPLYTQIYIDANTYKKG